MLQQKFTVDNQPELGQSAQLKLMPFQVEGVNWLCHNWNKSQNCILADEMGLVGEHPFIFIYADADRHVV